MIFMVEFGNKLRKAREEKGITQQTLAEKLFVTRQTVSNWECGKRYPDLITTKRISQILEVSLDDLLSEKEMTKELKRDSAVWSEIAYNVMLMLYTVLVLLLWNIPISHFMGFFAEPIRFIQEAKMFSLFIYIKFVAELLRRAVFLCFIIFAIRGTLMPKRMGIGWLTIFIINILVHSCNFLSAFYDCFTWQVAAITTSDILLNVIGAVGSIFFFIKGKRSKVWAIVLGGVPAIGFFGDVILFFWHNIKLSRIMPCDGFHVLGPLQMLILLILSLPLYIVLGYQVMVLYRQKNRERSELL